MKRAAHVLLLVSFATLGGCVAGGYYGDGGGYNTDANVGYGVDYYEPYGGYEAYGGCCVDYRFGPPGRGWDRDHGRGSDHDRGEAGREDPGRGNDHGHPRMEPGRGAGPGPRPSYRPAGPSRPMPSIPTGPRGGGGHPGGHGH